MFSILFAIVFFLTTPFCLLVARKAFRTHTVSGGEQLGWFMLGLGTWIFASGMELVMADAALKMFFLQVQYSSFVLIVPMLGLFLARYSHRAKRLGLKNKIALSGLPVISLVLVWTNGWHWLVWSAVSLNPVNNSLEVQPGLWLYVSVIYAFAIELFCILLILNNLMVVGKYFRPSQLVILVGLLIPIISGGLFIFDFHILPGLKVVSLGIVVMSLMFYWAVYSLHMLDLVPVARDFLIQYLRDGVIVLDDQLRLVDANQAAQDYLEIKPAMIGKPSTSVPRLREMFSQCAMPPTPDGWKRMLAEQNAVIAEFRLNPPGALHFRAQFSALLVNDGQEALSGFIINFSDISGLKLTEENLRINHEQLKLTLEGASWMIAFFDAQGHCIMVNEAFARAYGRAREACIGRHILEIVPPKETADTQQRLMRVLDGEKFQYTSSFMDADGSQHGSRTTFFPFLSNDGQINSFCVYMRDITRDAETESNQEERQQVLQDLVEDRTRILQDTINELASEIAERKRVEQHLRQMEETLAERVADQSRKLASLYNVMIAGGQSDSHLDMMVRTVDRVCAAVDGSAAAIHQIEGENLHLVVQYGMKAELVARIGLFSGEWVNDKLLLLPIARLAEASDLPDELRTSGYQSLVILPLRLRGQVTGLLSVLWEKEKQFSVEDLSLFTAVAEQVGVILENANLRQRFEEAATIKERRRLARELHDSVTQSLHSLIFSSFTATKRLKQGELDRLETSLVQMSESARQAVKEMRLLLYEMRLAPLNDIDFIDALETRLRLVEQRSGLKVRMEVDPGTAWPKAWEPDMFNIAIEALNNSLKYAQATEISVRLSGDPTNFSMEIADNGQGFDLARDMGAGMGIKSMSERAEHLGGKLSVTSAVGFGAKVLVRVISAG